MNAYEYYGNLNQALTMIEITIAKTEVQQTDEFDTINYADVLSKLYLFKSIINKMINIHKYFKMSKEAFVKSSENKTSKRIEVTHIVKDYESAQTIANLYGITIEEILIKNNILTTGIIAGMELKVEIKNSNALITIYDEIPTYGSQQGQLVLGVDISNDLTLNGDGDFQSLNNLETIKQGVLNRISTPKGGYPLVNDFGLEIQPGADLPSDLKDSMILIKVVNQIEQDSRISKIENVNVKRSQNSITIEAIMKTINNETLAL